MLVIKSLLLLLCSAAVVFAQIRAVVSDAIFVGENTVDDSASPLDVFRDAKNHAAAAGSVLVFSAEGANFYPTSQHPKSLVLNLDNFLVRASTFPGFFLESSEQGSLPLNGSLIQFEKIVREAGPVQPHQALVARTLRDMIPGYIVNENVDKWMLNLIVIDKPKGANLVKVIFVRVDMSIDTDETDTAYIPKQTATLTSTVLRATSPYLVEYAERLSDLVPIVKLRDALDFFASPKVEFDRKDLAEVPCHKNPLAFESQGQRSLYNWKNGN